MMRLFKFMKNLKRKKRLKDNFIKNNEEFNRYVMSQCLKKM